MKYVSALNQTPTRLALSRTALDSRILASIPLQSLRFASSSPSPSDQQTSTAATTATSETNVVDTAKTSTAAVPAVDKPKLPFQKRAWAVIKKEAAHYWAGTKLLGKEIKISSKITWKVLNGGQLTRRERRQVGHSPRSPHQFIRLIPFYSLILASSYHYRLVTIDSILSLCDCPLHGNLASRRPEALPQHVAFNL